MSVDLSVPFRDASTVNRRSFSRVSKSEHLSRSGAFPFAGFALVVFFPFGVIGVEAHRLSPHFGDLGSVCRRMVIDQ